MVAPNRPVGATPVASGRLNLDQAKAVIHLKFGEILLRTVPGSSVFDPTFPRMIRGTFAEQELLAWQARRAAASSAPASLTPPPCPPVPAPTQSTAPAGSPAHGAQGPHTGATPTDPQPPSTQ